VHVPHVLSRAVLRAFASRSHIAPQAAVPLAPPPAAHHAPQLSSASRTDRQTPSAVELQHVYDALSDAFLDMDDACLTAARQDAGAAPPPPPQLRLPPRASRSAGSTALALLLRASGSAVTAFCANVGDSRAVLCRGGAKVDLSFDHKCTRRDEATRIFAAGGSVIGGRLFGVLAVSRAFGDPDFKAAAVAAAGTPGSPTGKPCGDALIAEPEVAHECLGADDEFILLACDGVWDVLSSQKAVNFVRRRLYTHGDVARATRELVDKALARGSVDNCSAVLVQYSPALERQ